MPCRDGVPAAASRSSPSTPATGSSSSASSPTTRPTRPATFIADVRRDLADRHRPGRDDQAGVPGRRPAPELLHRPRRDPPLDPDRRGDRRRLRAAVRPDLGRRVTRGRRPERPAGDRGRGPAPSATAAGRSSTGPLVPGRAPARSFALLGPNGAGKTTTVEILEGYRRADERHGPGPRRRPGGRGAGPPGAGRADAPGRRRDRPTDDRPRGPPAPRPRSTRRPRPPTSCSGSSDWPRRPAGRATGGCRAASGSGSGSRWRSSAGRSSSILDEPTAGMDVEAPGGDAGAAAGTPRRTASTVLLTSHDLADVERIGRPPRDPRPRPDRRAGVAAGARGRRRCRCSGSGSRLPLSEADRVDLASRLRDVDGAARRVARRRGRGPLPRRRARRRRRRLVAALPPGAASAARSSSSCGPAAASLEERYLELVGGGGCRRTAAPDAVGRRPRRDRRAGLAGDARDDRDGAAARPPPRREPRRDDRAAGRRPRVLQLDRHDPVRRRPRPVDFLLPGLDRARDRSRRASSASGSRPPTTATTAS